MDLITTATGKAFECNVVITDKKKTQLFVYVKKQYADEAVKVFADERELPLEGYDTFTVLDRIDTTMPDGGVNVCLKRA